MINLFIGIAIGAAFAPLWLKLWEMAVTFFKEEIKLALFMRAFSCAGLDER